MPKLVRQFVTSVDTLDKGLDDFIDSPDDAEVDIATMWPVEFEEGIAAYHTACLKLAETLHVRRSTVEQAVSRHFRAEEIQRLFDAHGGLAKYKERACSALKRKRCVEAKKVSNTLTSDNFTWTLCPVTQTMFKKPYLLKKCGHTFEYTAIRALRTEQNGRTRCPNCRKPFDKQQDIIHNYALAEAIKWFKMLPKATKNRVTE